MEDRTHKVVHHEHGDETLLTTISDRKYQLIIRTLANRALTATEIADEIDVPLSTVYRKLDCLLEASLVSESYRLAPDGHRPDEYRCIIDAIYINLPGERAEGIEVELITGERNT